MKRKVVIRSALSLISLLIVAALLLFSGSTGETADNTPTSNSPNATPNTTPTSSESTDTATAEGTVTDNSTNESYELEKTVSGSLTSFTARSDDYSIGYYVSDGQVVSSNSLFADADEAVSSLDLNLTSNGVGFTSVYATGEDTVLDLTGKIAASDTGNGQDASDFTGLGTQIVAANYARVNVSN